MSSAQTGAFSGQPVRLGSWQVIASGRILRLEAVTDKAGLGPIQLNMDGGILVQVGQPTASLPTSFGSAKLGENQLLFYAKRRSGDLPSCEVYFNRALLTEGAVQEAPLTKEESERRAVLRASQGDLFKGTTVLLGAVVLWRYGISAFGFVAAGSIVLLNAGLFALQGRLIQRMEGSRRLQPGYAGPGCGLQLAAGGLYFLAFIVWMLVLAIVRPQFY